MRLRRHADPGHNIFSPGIDGRFSQKLQSGFGLSCCMGETQKKDGLEMSSYTHSKSVSKRPVKSERKLAMINFTAIDNGPAFYLALVHGGCEYSAHDSRAGVSQIQPTNTGVSTSGTIPGRGQARRLSQLVCCPCVLLWPRSALVQASVKNNNLKKNVNT